MNDLFINQSLMAYPEPGKVDNYTSAKLSKQADIYFSSDTTVIDLFEKQAELTPQAIALTFKEKQYSYKEINGYSNQLAHYLVMKGVRKEMLIPVFLERSCLMIISVLGILKAGAAYIPIEVDYPAERIRFMLTDTDACVAISSDTSRSKLPYAKNLDVIELDEGLAMIRQQPKTNLEHRSTSHHLAYIIYTSGSTGKPKGVMIEHKGLLNLAVTQALEFGLKPGTKVLQFASFGFDASCSEIFTTLISGGCLVLPQKKDLLSAEEFETLINTHKVEVVTLPPSYQSVIKDSLGTIKTIISAGEPLNSTIGRYLQSKGVRLINAYGPTENTVCVTMSDDPVKDNHVIVIGKPISNVTVFILNKAGHLCPAGITGEICVAGVQVARGYLNRADLTAEKFVANPFTNEEADRMYKTGDLGRWCADGNIEFLGRTDDQIKIRGYRIEPGEIEKVLNQCNLIKQAVVAAKEDAAGITRLVAYVIPKDFYNKKDIVAYVKEVLPEFMIPSTWVKLERFPTTSNGKIDKKALPEPDMTEVLNTYTAPRTEVEKKLVAIWQNVFHIKLLGIRDNFFDLGGSSILSIQMVNQARRAGYNLQPSDFFIHQDIEALAGLISERLLTRTTKHKHYTKNLYQKKITIIPFNDKGKKVPFFFMSPGFSVYNKLIITLGYDQPVNFFIPQPYKSVEQIAAYYIEELKKMQPHGPYCLGGYCGFGEVALEAAQQLNAQGEKVMFLALFEFYFPTAFKTVEYKQRLSYYYNELKIISIKEKASLLYEFLQRKLKKVKRRTSKMINQKIKNLPETTGYLIGKNLYAAKPYNGTVLLFRSKIRTAKVSDDPFMGWSSYFTGKIHAYTIEGDHKTMFHEPGVVQIAESLMANTFSASL